MNYCRDTSQSYDHYWDSMSPPYNDHLYPKPYVTQHARVRFAERTDINAEEVDDFAAQAICFGKSCNDFYGEYRRYLLEKCTADGHPIVYGGLILIVSPCFSVITVYKPPFWWFAQYPHVDIPSPHDSNIFFRCWKAVSKAVQNNFLWNKRGSYWH